MTTTSVKPIIKALNDATEAGMVLTPPPDAVGQQHQLRTLTAHHTKTTKGPRPQAAMKSRGMGRIFRPYYRDKKTGERHQVATWYVEYFCRGKQQREKTGSTNRADAVRLLKKRLGEHSRGQFHGRDIEKTTFEQIKAMALDHYRANGRRSLDRFEDAVAHLTEVFALYRVQDITPDRITAYVAERKADGAANATINRELAALRLMLRLG